VVLGNAPEKTGVKAVWSSSAPSIFEAPPPERR